MKEETPQWEETYNSIRCISGGVGIKEEGMPTGTYQYHKCGRCGRKWHFGETPPICQEYRSKYPNDKAFIKQQLEKLIDSIPEPVMTETYINQLINLKAQLRKEFL